MGLSTNLRNAVQKALKSLGTTDADGPLLLVTYTQVTPTAYDAATDTMGALTTAYNNVPCALVRMEDSEREWAQVDLRAQKALIAYNDLPIDPEQQDYLTIGGTRWNIKRIKKLPSTPLHILYIQEP